MVCYSGPGDIGRLFSGFTLAIGLSDLHGHEELKPGELVAAEDQPRGRIEVDMPARDGKGTHAIHGQLPGDRLRVGVIESVQHVLVVAINTFRDINCLAQEQLDVLVLANADDAVNRMGARKGVENYRQDHRDGIDFHVARNHLIDGQEPVDPFGKSLDEREVMDIADLNLFRVEHGASLVFDEPKADL